MVVIRLSRGGTNKRPFYRVVAADSRAPRDGKYLERLGYFNPIAAGGEKRLELDRERVNYWFSQGAQASERVTSLIVELDKPELLERRKKKKEARRARQKAKALAKNQQGDSAESRTGDAAVESAADIDEG